MQQNRQLKPVWALAAALTSMTWTCAAVASGFALREGSAAQTGDAYSSNTAGADDPATVYSNPAGMVLLDGTQIEDNLTGILPSFKFSGQDFVGPGVTVPGKSSTGNVVENAYDPALYAVFSFSHDLKFGLSVNAPFGLQVANPDGWVGRYQSLVSRIFDIELGLQAAYRVNDHFAIGGGPIIDYFESRLTQAINTGPTAAITGDPILNIHADPNISAGYQLGMMYMVNPDLRFGFDYRSKIYHSGTFTEGITVPALLSELSPPTAAFLLSQQTSATSKIVLPDSLHFGGYWQVTPRLAFMVDADWTDWSTFPQLVFHPLNGAPAQATPEAFHNTWGGSIGTHYQLTPALLLRAGLGADASPVRSDNRTSRLPDYNRLYTGLGASYQVFQNISATLGWNHLFAGGASIDNSAVPTAGVLVGRYSNHADSVALGLTAKF